MTLEPMSKLIMMRITVAVLAISTLGAAETDTREETQTAVPTQNAGNPSGLDKQYAHKISLVWNPANETYYMVYNAIGNEGRGIGLITSKALVNAQHKEELPDETMKEEAAGNMGV